MGTIYITFILGVLIVLIDAYIIKSIVIAIFGGILLWISALFCAAYEEGKNI